MRILLSLLLSMGAYSVYAQSCYVTFQVDMSQVSAINTTISVAGNFQDEAGFGGDWGPGSAIMTDPEMDDIYELTVSIPVGTYRYIFVNGSSWGEEEAVPVACAVSGGNTREIEIVSNIILPAVCFSECNECTGIGIQKSELPYTLSFENGAGDMLYLDFSQRLNGKKTIEIIDSRASIIHRMETSESNCSIDIAAMQSGIYFLRIIAGQEVYSVKFMVD